MSKREDIASHIVSTISGISSPSIKKVTRQPFNLEELSCFLAYMHAQVYD